MPATIHEDWASVKFTRGLNGDTATRVFAVVGPNGRSLLPRRGHEHKIAKTLRVTRRRLDRARCSPGLLMVRVEYA